MKKPVKKIAVIHDICGVGKAAMSNITPILSIMGIEVCQIPTMLLSTHTGGYGKPYIQPIDGYMMGCLTHYLEQDVQFDMIFVGYLGTLQRVQEVKEFLTLYKNVHPNTSIILDPIFGDHGVCYANFTQEYVQAMRTLLPYADIILPNYTEYCMLIEKPVEQTNTDLFNWNKKLEAYQIQNAIITSIPMENTDEIGIEIQTKEQRSILKFPCCKESFHGTGDIFAAVFCGASIQGNSIEEACKKAHHFVATCIEESCKYEYDKREGVILEPLLKYLL
ncbi:pyridoxamine kinase [Anaerosporobacter faecicola]|uniref:pyridoxamine kinase n=1 Tax=Anaerosporobacter faecicola TaxID=2718714 RepID=UPI00143BE9F2|nr:pyridoxamine kinase [Anaerosporobacter faecicola]